jgi:hypothetical protein
MFIGTLGLFRSPNEVVITISPTTLNNFTSGEAYSQLVLATGGRPAYTFSLESGSLPNGLTLDPSGLLFGIPQLGSLTLYPRILPDVVNGSGYSEQVFARNGSGPYTYQLESGQLPPGITLNSDGTIEGTAFIESPNLVINPRTLQDAVNGTTYEATILASNGQLPYTFTLETGNLPPNLTLNSNGTISGTVVNNLLLSPSSLPDASNGDVYLETIIATNGESPYTFAVSNGTLPPGLSIDNAGNITGTILE